MKNIIVTIKSIKTSEIKDYEIPSHMKAKDIIKKMAEILNLPKNTAHVTYKINVDTLGRYLMPEESLEEAGVWDGAILTIEK